MATEVLKVDPVDPEPDVIARAAEFLRAGRLVAFPTETVYGLGAIATDAEAVRRIFTAKGRPPTNPLIVHVWDVAGAQAVCSDWSATAQQLAARFWPGPLTFVLPRREELIPDVVTASGPTVAVRIPAHPVALALLEATGLPVAAPSANRSTQLSPTRAEHVLRSLGGRIELILDAGPTPGGIESTVLDLTTSPPRLLRPGLVTPAELEAVIGSIARGPMPASGEPQRSPGMMERHYAPRTPLELASDGRSRVEELHRGGQRAGWLTFREPDDALPADIVSLSMPSDPIVYAAQLYAALHALDEAGVAAIVVDAPPTSDDWLAVRDRLCRAAERAEEAPDVG
jgi:L-threonylcarbamoyladenylate synthase